MKKNVKFLFGVLMMWVSCLVLAQPAPALESIEKLDLPRYLGRWYEISRYPNSFQRQCVADSVAQYSLLPDGDVQVDNRCARASGETQSAVGRAYRVGGEGSAKLKVRFAPQWLSFLPFVWGDYWVVDLDDAYELVAVSEPKREYLWVLSRAPKVDGARYAALLSRLAVKGFDVERLVLTPQRGSLSGR